MGGFMSTRSITREVRLKHWASLINERLSSGKTVAKFCEEHEICVKTYYYWLKQVREAAYLTEYQNQGNSLTESAPVFAELNFRQAEPGIGAIIVRIGGASCEIRNGAGKDIIENTLFALNRLC
jgi:transposase-like protein